jgi:hypothetical protein
MIKKKLTILIALTLLAGPVPASESEESETAASLNQALSEEVVETTNERYNHDCFWGGPKGLDYGLLPGAQPIQKPALYPDKGSTYFVGQFKLPAGASLMIQGVYPHERYFSFTAAHNLPNGGLGGGDFRRDDEIHPDPGSVNPFKQTNKRDATPRNYTVHIVQGDPPTPPEKRRPNTVYTSSNDPDTLIHLAMRNYIPDEGYDGTGVTTLQPQDNPHGLPTVTLLQPGKKPLRGSDMCNAVQAVKTSEPTEYPAGTWDELVALSWDAANAPAKRTPVWELFWDINYSVTGFFVPDQVTRVALFPPTDAGGFAQNPDTQYLTSTFSLGFGSVYVIRAKMPTHPKTKLGERNWTPDTQVRYWSTCTGAAPPSGAGWDCVWDEGVPVDDNGMYTLVVSRPADRPDNAREECGVKWVSFGKGEGDYEGARPWVNTVYMRFMVPNQDWPQSPTKIPMPSGTNPYPQDAYVMQEYFPTSHYETKLQYESHGCPVPIE